MSNSAGFDSRPFSADYLQETWENLMHASGYTGRAFLQVVTSDPHGQEIVTNAPEDFHRFKVDSIATFCGENGHNLKVTGCLYNPWWSTLTAIHWALMGLVLAGCIFLFFIQDDIILLWKPNMTQRRNTDVTAELRYDVARGQLVRGDKVVQLTAMPARLLQGLLEAEEHQLTVQEIHQLLWPEDRELYPHRLHTCISRLRGYLAEISNWKVVNKGQAYRLICDDNLSSR